MTVWTALTVVVFLLLGPPVGLGTFVAACGVVGIWDDDAAMVLFAARKLLIVRPGAIVALTYLVGAPAAGLSGIVVARIRRGRRDREAVRVALAGLTVGAAVVLTCAVMPLGILKAVALVAAPQVIAACIVATVACWLLAAVLTRLIEPLAGPDSLVP